VATSEEDLQTCARLYAEAEFPLRPSQAPPPSAASDGRITIGYLCGEFRQHATTILMAGVYEAHDRARFRLVAFDNGGPDDSTYRRRLEAAFDEIVDIRAMGDAQAAEAVRARHVDILVNLNGYYGEGRMGVFARRAAPVQVNYLGFPGTLGAGYIDYLLADPVVIPPDCTRWYAEEVVHLPHCYQANDSAREWPPLATDRTAHGLPAQGFVYCCFNNNYKLTPARFASWMRILQRVPGSVLWVLEDNPEVPPNLRKHAQLHGVDPQRLVFAPRLPPTQHLARHGCADLFLDTAPYNAHTTASDALWMGLPVLTTLGTTFPGRVAASLLRAVGVPELVADDEKTYENLAVALASDAPRLAALRETLHANRLSCALFDTAAFTRDLEAAFARMVQRHRGS
jgi:predicted O-linked N-acetylglucosamine transferase (SPINDLY family)